MPPRVLVTGFPGFLGSALVPHILARRSDARVLCLVQPHVLDIAQQRVRMLVTAHPSAAGRLELVTGDITRPDLGLADARASRRDLVEVFHLAAVYDLAVTRDTAHAVNVTGTSHVLDFAAASDRLERVHHVSTCYVSGRTPGTFRETDLDRGQAFNNWYEESKYLAERDVRHRADAGLPVTIYRPAVVVGDSGTGETQKYDGPYFVMRLALRQRGLAVIPVVGRTRDNVFNVVPRDFVVSAIAHLSGLRESLGQTYHLADPHPPTVSGMLDAIEAATGTRQLRVPLPLGLARPALRHVPGVRRLIDIPEEAMDYFVHPTRYDTSAARRDLAGTGITVPPFADYVDQLVAFMRTHPGIRADAMV